MKDSYTDITIVLDRSGSMSSVANDTIGGFNRFVADQKAVPGECTLTLVQFDSQDPFEVVHRGKRIADIPQLTSETFQPRAATPLLDCIGKTINDTGARLSGIPEQDRPDKVLFVIITDGHENASREFSKAQIDSMIREQSDKWKWNFVFLGANQDAIAVGASIGIAKTSSMTYAATPDGARESFRSLSCNTVSLRSGATDNYAWTNADRDAQAVALSSPA